MHKSIDPSSLLLLIDKKAKLGRSQMSSGTGPHSFLSWTYNPRSFRILAIIVGIGPVNSLSPTLKRVKPRKLPTSLGMPPMSLEFSMWSYSRLLERFPIDDGKRSARSPTKLVQPKEELMHNVDGSSRWLVVVSCIWNYERSYLLNVR